MPSKLANVTNILQIAKSYDLVSESTLLILWVAFDTVWLPWYSISWLLWYHILWLWFSLTGFSLAISFTCHSPSDLLMLTYSMVSSLVLFSPLTHFCVFFILSSGFTIFFQKSPKWLANFYLQARSLSWNLDLSTWISTWKTQIQEVPKGSPWPFSPSVSSSSDDSNSI